MKNLKLFSILFLVSSVAIISCSKGTAGPAGPAGPAGAGETMHSSWISLVTPYVGKDNNGDSLFQQAVTSASLTQNILDSGLVLSYFELSDGSVIDVADFSSFIDVAYTLNTITITGIGTNLSNVLFRYVIIPGTTTITGALKQYTKAQIKDMSYSTITKLLGITDKPGYN